VYGPAYERQIEIARSIRDILEQTDGVVDVDWYVEGNQTKYSLKIDKEKAAINGITAEQITQTMRVAVDGLNVGLLHLPNEKEDAYINLRLPKADRSSIADIQQIKVVGNKGNLVPVSELVTVQELKNDKSIYHKNLMPVVYVTADVAGAIESPVYAILGLSEKVDEMKLPEGYALERYVASQPFLTDKYSMKWDGEWHITYEVFRDMGIAFAAVMVLIYILVVGWFQSFKTPLTIMAAIPFSLVGILPAHALMGAFFTATSMIGFIAGAGIVVRNSIILVDFVQLRMSHGMPLIEAVVDAGAVRFRPMLLTAAAVIVGSSVMLFDPIFQGLAISLMAGEVASLLLSRMAVPVLFYLSERKQHPETSAASGESVVLCPTDFSPQSAIAMKFAEKISRVFGAKLRVLHAAESDLPPYFTEGQLQEIASEEQQVENEGILQIKGFANEHLGAENRFDAVFVDDSPTAAILAESLRANTLLVALGTHGRIGFEKLRFGSVAETVLRESQTPVLTVSGNVKGVESVNIRKIVCPVDLTPESENALRYAAEMARQFDAEVFVINVGSKDSTTSADEELAILCSWVPAEAKAQCKLQEFVRNGDIAEELLTAASELSADLIVIGARHGIFSDETLGEHTSEIVRNAGCPVITIPIKK
ncbi:MAG: efflux RND transporter permease subunit, partial [Pyrinomonadaceae bacterium]